MNNDVVDAGVALLSAKERRNSDRLKALIQSYEAQTDQQQKAQIHAAINQISPVSEFELNSYYGSSTLDAFCALLATEVLPGEALSREVAIEIVRRACRAFPNDIRLLDHLEHKYGNAVDYVFRKADSLGAILDAHHHDAAAVIAFLESDADGPILL